ncbi:hypothetical protein EFQ99_23890 [Rhizobium vallis]|uniref:Uncharacterized protein n=1 Tax=Rhizobium vallis TaxID=634290 RepID=A0A3S0Y2Z5_9HYPH|nr:hypothetical protein EFQ99_23890 [Rhizobium vallis]
MRFRRVLCQKTPPQPLPTRGRDFSAEALGNGSALLQRFVENSASAACWPLPLVGRGWGGV